MAELPYESNPQLLIEVKNDYTTHIIDRNRAGVYGVRLGFPDHFWDDMEAGSFPWVRYRREGKEPIGLSRQLIKVEGPRRYLVIQPEFWRSLPQAEMGVHTLEFFGKSKSVSINFQWTVPRKDPVPWKDDERKRSKEIKD